MRARTARSFSRNAGFTFVEILAAMLFLAILIPTVLGALALSNRTGVLSERTTTAMQLAENRLNEALLDATWSSGVGGGDFGQEWPGYRWELINRDWPEDSMTELTMVVSFQVQGQDHEVRLTTLASETSAQP